MRKILTSFSLVAASLAFAQVGINAEESDIAKDAVFHVENKSGEAKGVILPSVSLTAADDQTTITEANGDVTTGLMVWNDGTAGLTPAGYYYWDGAKWVLTGNVDSGSSAQPFPATTRTVIEAPGNDVKAAFQSELDNGRDPKKVLIVRLTGTKQDEIVLPDASLYPGQVISLNNEVSGNATYSTGALAGLTTAIRVASAHLLWSDGVSWWCLSSRNG